MINTKQNLHALTEITLARHKLWTIEGDRRGDVISCQRGTLWITQDKDLKDYIVEAGGSFWVSKPGIVVVQAVDDARFTYSLNELRNHIEINAQPNRRITQSYLKQPMR